MTTPSDEKNSEVQKTAHVTANVFGATGAVGKAVVRHLLHDYDSITVQTIGRRKVADLEQYEESGRLVQVVVPDMDQMRTADIQRSDMSFCCLGTTRASAGSADQFRKVDLEYVESAACVAKQSGCRAFALVSAQGARASMISSDLKMFHGLLYMKTKGMAEERVKAQGFEYTLIMRPGLIDRKEDARGIETFAKRFVRHISTDALASVMIRKTLGVIASSNQPEQRCEVLEMHDILKAAAAAAH